jgi:hypothetical protein
MKTTKNVKYVCALAVVLLTGLVSCDDKVELNGNDSSSVENEAVVDGYFEDTDDIALTAVSSDSSPLTGDDGGRVISNDILDHRFKCATVTIELAADNSKSVPHGTITIDFGTGCTDNQGNVRKGKVIVDYKGRRFYPGSTVVTTTDGYSINGITLEGTRTVTNVSGSTDEAPKFNIVLENGKATWPDASVATREVNRTREWIRASNPLNDEWHVTGTANGTNREGKVYEMEITSALVYKRECAITAKIFMPVAGTKELTVNGRKLTIDYGTGDCDRTVTVSVDGSSKQIEI